MTETVARGPSPRGPSSRLFALLAFVLPPACLLAVYHPGLWAWFHDDDFTLLWNVMRPEHEFWADLFQPRAQGTYRTLSERLYFFYFHRWFGLDAFPYRALAFATQITNLGLFAGLARRLTRSWVAATVAASLWAVHAGLAVTMSWSSAYNEGLYSFFLLAALHLFVTSVEKRCWIAYVAQYALFLVGFGALEAIVVYPGVALLYCVVYRRDRWLWALPLFVGAGFLAWVQLHASPPEREGLYSMSFAPADLLAMLGFYLKRAFTDVYPGQWHWLLAASLAGGSVWAAMRGEWAGLFGWGWFLGTLAPFLPLYRHPSEYYLFLPAAGLALAAGAVAARCRSWRGWIVAAVLITLHLGHGIPYARKIVARNVEISVRARNLITGLRYARAQHPRATILLTGVDDDFYYSVVDHEIFRLAEVFQVYLAPDYADIPDRPGFQPVSRNVLEAERVKLAIARDELVAYDASGRVLREVTRRYEEMAPLRLGAESKEPRP